MPQRRRRSDLHPHVQAILDETGEEDPFEAVRIKARAVVDQYHGALGEVPPFNMQAVASVRGLRWSDDDPRYSADSEIAPEADGSVVLRVNKTRPLVRQRFSIGHEIGHTLFPEYELAVRCRKANVHTWADPNDLLETLCDVAASEILFPAPWFNQQIGAMAVSAATIAEVAAEYQGSREATVRRLVELSAQPMAAVFFSWKLKPKEKKAVNRNKNQIRMFDDSFYSEPSPMLRVNYAIINPAFSAKCGTHIPKDKSIPSEGPIFAASMAQTTQDGVCELDFGTVKGRFSAHVLPVFTAEEATGPDGGCSVVAVLTPARFRYQ
jgi:Zn-dependent peptidase ImmA (M78 family)